MTLSRIAKLRFIWSVLLLSLSILTWMLVFYFSNRDNKANQYSFDDYLKNNNIDDRFIEQFKQIALKNDIRFDDTQWNRDFDFIHMKIKNIDFRIKLGGG